MKATDIIITPLENKNALAFLKDFHYLKDSPIPDTAISFAAAVNGEAVGVIVFVPELSEGYYNLMRMAVMDKMPKNTESHFISGAIKALGNAKVITTTVQPSEGHDGTVYLAANFKPVALALPLEDVKAFELRLK